MLVGLLALGLVASSLATRDMGLLPLIWAQAIVPGLAAAWILFVPASAELGLARRVRQAARLAGKTTPAGAAPKMPKIKA